jgi:hypothetical protein
MKLIRCTKCGKEIPSKLKKKFKFLWWFLEYYTYENAYWESHDFGIHLCLDCMKLFKKWLKIE